mmetsp:Transcript_15181/g.19036  ORF Transcript_15181/g.19036 Transcript_15181/m.19036 type:complete len:87 (-) Transcript_15181:47-307(-)
MSKYAGRQKQKHRFTYFPANTCYILSTSQNVCEKSIDERKSGMSGIASLCQISMHSGSSQTPWLLMGGCTGRPFSPKKSAMLFMAC